MKTIEVNIYKFEELSEEAKQVAIQKEINSSYEDPDLLHFFSEGCEEQIKEAGFIDPKIQYSLSYSQGDGLSFEASGIDGEILTKMFIDILGENKKSTAQLIAENCTIEIKGNRGHYCFAAKSDIDLYLENYLDTPNIDKIVNQVLENLENKYIDLCNTLESNGYSELEYQTSEDAAKENIIANECDYTENGVMY